MKVFLKILAWLAGILVVLFLAVEIALSPRVLGSIVDAIVPRFIDGKLEHGAIKLDIVTRFPKVRVNLQDVLLTYPAERFASLDSLYRDGRGMLEEGNGPGSDTLASFSKLSASVNVLELLSGKIRIPSVELENPRAFLKFYDDSTSNLKIFRTAEKKDTLPAPFPKISVDKVTIEGAPFFYCCFPRNDVYMDLAFNSLKLKGKIRTYRWEDSRAHLLIDSLLFSASLGKDTYRLDLRRLDIDADDREVSLDMEAKVSTLTRMFGSLDLPLDIQVAAGIPQDSLVVLDLDHFKARLAGIPLFAEGTISFSPDRTSIDARAEISDCSLDTLATRLGSAYWSSLSDEYFNTKINLEASCRGDFIPKQGIKPVLDAKVNKLCVDGAGLSLDLKGEVKDLLRGDAEFDVDASLDANLGDVMPLVPEELGIDAGGDISASVKGKLRQSQLDIEHIARSDVQAYVKSDDFHLSMPLDTVDISLKKFEASLEGSRSKSIEEISSKARMLYANMNVGYVSANIKNNTVITGNSISVTTHNDAALLSSLANKAQYVLPFGGQIHAGRMSMISGGKTLLGLRNSTQDFRVLPKAANPKIPVLSFTSRNGNVFLKSESNRIRLADLDLDVKAVMNGIERRTRIIHVVDSLSHENPTVPKDSLMIYMRRARQSSKDIPSWMQEKDFRKYDFSLNLDEKFKKIFMEWDIEAKLGLSNGSVLTPFYPLRSSVTSLGCHMTNDEIRIDSLSILSGESDLSLYGKIDGLRRFIFGGGTADMDLDIESGNINANEILGAIHEGSKISLKDAAALSSLSDSQYEKAVVIDTITTDQGFESPLIVLPGNIDANVNVDAGAIQVSNFGISSFATQLALKQRCLQITNTVATSDIANLFFEGFYSTQSKQDLQTGFSLSLMDVTAEKVIELVPALDTIVPILKNLSGLVNLDVAATTRIDTLMNLDLPSLAGVIRVEGKDLAIYDSEQFKKLAKILMFKNKNSAFVDSLSIEGLLLDNKLEVFPFIINMDRYQLAVSGLQNLDSSFKYHASVIHSPLFFKFGIDLAGDFQNSRLRLGKPKYRNADKIPIFSTVIDDARVNLSKSIKNIFRKGVEAAIKENESQESIAEFKERNSYVAAIDIQLDSLSNKELYQIDSLSSQSDTIEIEDAVIASY